MSQKFFPYVEREKSFLGLVWVESENGKIAWADNIDLDQTITVSARQFTVLVRCAQEALAAASGNSPSIHLPSWLAGFGSDPLCGSALSQMNLRQSSLREEALKRTDQPESETHQDRAQSAGQRPAYPSAASRESSEDVFGSASIVGEAGPGVTSRSGNGGAV